MTDHMTAGEAVNFLRTVVPKTPLVGVVAMHMGSAGIEIVPPEAPKAKPKRRRKSAKVEGDGRDS